MEELDEQRDEALAVFPDGAPSKDQLTRCRQYGEAGEYAKSLMERLTTEYYHLQGESDEHCLYRKLSLFAVKQLATEQKGGG